MIIIRLFVVGTAHSYRVERQRGAEMERASVSIDEETDAFFIKMNELLWNRKVKICNIIKHFKARRQDATGHDDRTASGFIYDLARSTESILMHRIVAMPISALTEMAIKATTIHHSSVFVCGVFIVWFIDLLPFRFPRSKFFSTQTPPTFQRYFCHFASIYRARRRRQQSMDRNCSIDFHFIVLLCILVVHRCCCFVHSRIEISSRVLCIEWAMARIQLFYGILFLAREREKRHKLEADHKRGKVILYILYIKSMAVRFLLFFIFFFSCSGPHSFDRCDRRSRKRSHTYSKK